MNTKQIESKIRDGKQGRYRIETGLYLRVYGETSGHFIARYTYLQKRKEIALGKFSIQGDCLSLSEARDKHLEIKKQLKKGLDPLDVKKRGEKLKLTRVDDIAKDWLKTCDQKLENPQIPRRIYKKDIAPIIGQQSINQVSPPDIVFLLRKINDSDRPTIANDALGYLKKLFNHAIKLGLITSNPSLAFSIHDAGDVEKKGTRALTFTEIPIVLRLLHQHSLQFTWENYLTIILLLCLGVRKTELTDAKWQEFN
jgi:integrase